MDVSGGVAIGSYAGANTAPSNGMIVSGNIGIGTPNPQSNYQLHVAGNNPAINIEELGTSNSALVFSRIGIGKWYILENYGSPVDNISFYDGSTASKVFQINQGGNVGIGTTNPTQRLDVNGNVKFSGALMPNNLPGTAGQVLTSAGAGAPPTWNAAATNVVATSESGANTFMTANNVVYNYSGGQVTITVPRSGTIVVQANANVVLDHVNGILKTLVLNIGTTNTDGGDYPNAILYDIPAAFPTFPTALQTFTVRKAFTVTAGTYTYYLNGLIYQGASGNDNFNYSAMEAIFY